MARPEWEGTARPDTDYSRADLDKVWADQAMTLVEHGFHMELGLTEKLYLGSLPKFPPRPEEATARFDIPVLIDPRIPLDQLVALVGISYYRYEDQVVSDWVGNQFTSPSSPYGIWAGIKDEPVPTPDELKKDEGEWTSEKGRLIRDYVADIQAEHSIPVIRKHLAADERGATAVEGIFYYLYNSEIFRIEEGKLTPHLLMIGTSFERSHPSGRPREEHRLFLGRYQNAEIWLTDNGDSIDSSGKTSRALVVART